MEQISIPKVNKITGEIIHCEMNSIIWAVPKTFDKNDYNMNEEKTLTHKRNRNNEKDDVMLENLIRWRIKKDKNKNIIYNDNGEPAIESNTRLVKWSDGSYQLLVGKNAFNGFK